MMKHYRLLSAVCRTQSCASLVFSAEVETVPLRVEPFYNARLENYTFLTADHRAQNPCLAGTLEG